MVKEEKEVIRTAIERDIQQDKEQIVTDRGSSDLMRALDSLSNPSCLESGTILTNRQVIALTVINRAAQVYDIKFLKSFVKLFPRYRISGDDGRGRKEIIQIAEAIQRDKEQQNQRFMEMLGRR